MNKKIYIILVIISILYFGLFIFPNNTNASDQSMLSVFEPDEFAQYPHVIHMVKFQGDTLRQKVWHFVAYQHYYYGFPFYALSALVLIPVKLIAGIDNVQLNMLVLRQVVSVLPMISSVWVLVYLQTRFKNTWKSVIMFVFLLSIPIVVKNNLWWHPDSLAILFSVLVIYFLDKDDLEFGNNFIYAAVSVGLSIGTKMLGWFFFLTIPMYLIWGVFNHKISWLDAVKKAILFIIVMFSVTVISNPALIHPHERERYLAIQLAQSKAMGFGWDVAYEKGLLSWLPIIIEYYGHWLFLLAAWISLIIGMCRKEARLLHVLILSWVVPMSVYILLFVAIKPKHLLLPIALPLFSTLNNIIPSRAKADKGRTLTFAVIPLLVIILIQLGQNLILDSSMIQNKLVGELHPAISFYNELDNQILGCLPVGKKVKIYRDVRVYVPNRSEYDVHMRWGVVDYDIVSSINPDLLLLQQQRINDYTQPDVIDNAQDKNQMNRTYLFYQDADNKEIVGYSFLFEDEFGIAFLRDNTTNIKSCEN